MIHPCVRPGLPHGLMNAFNPSTVIVGLGLLTWMVTAAHGAEAGQVRLVPFPKEIQAQVGQFSLTRTLVFQTPERERGTLARPLNDELQRAGLRPVETASLASPVLAFRLAAETGPLELPPLPTNTAPEGYSLEVRPHEVIGAAREPAGLLYGLQTLRQLIRANRHGDALPCLSIRDWPSLRWRAFQDDLTRGPSSTLDTLKFEASLGAYLKLNLMTYYMEYQFAFAKHPLIGPTNGSLRPTELSALVDYAKPLHLDVLGNQQSFGHFGSILKHPEYAGLRETADVLSPVREQTYQLLDDLYSEVCPLLPFPWFNVCCDETYGLGTGPARELAQQIGVGGVYVRHIRRVHDLLRDRHGKRMMMWGDIILQHPDRLTEVPKDTIMLTWGYDARPSFEDQIVPFAGSGYEFFVCPGVNNWSRILPDFGVAITNIRNFVRDGAKHGALGMINTDWEDDGETLNAVKWHADAWAAECAWNGSTTATEAFNQRIGAVLFGEGGDHFGQAVGLLAKTHRLAGMKGMMNARFWEDDFAPKAGPAAIESGASNLLALVRPALQHLEASRREARCNQNVIDALRFGARRMELIGQRMLDGLEAARRYEAAGASPTNLPNLDRVKQLIRRNRDAHETLGKEFATLWLSQNKPYALDWTLRRYTDAVNRYDALLQRVTTARTAAAAGQALPAPEDIGLAIPRPLSRLIPTKAPWPTPLAPEAPWAEPSSTQRVGLVVRAGAADRFDLPVEVELELPDDLAAKTVRTFVLGAEGVPREVLAQLNSTSLPGKCRLTLVLPGPFLKDTEVPLHVYLGLAEAPVLPGAVRTSPDSNGMQWLENDRVRLLLGPEGAHVYRWELKAAGNRDLTMPGESGWAGFCDMAPYRQAQYRLACTARGPAMVEYQCSDPSGHTKTLRLYSGASWIEVFLSEPTSIYWDFDNPVNFAADGPAPGTWLFSNGQTGPVGREADGVPAQVESANVFWGIKHSPDKLALGLITPESAALHHVAPGSGAGGVGIEGSPPVMHCVTFAGVLERSPAETMSHLHTTLDLKRPVEVVLHGRQTRRTTTAPR